MEIDGRSIRKLERLIRRVPQKADEGMRDGMGYIAEDLRNEIIRRELFWQGNLLGSIRVEQNPEVLGSYFVKMMEYGVDLDRAPASGHFISLKRGRKITRWAAEKGLIESPWTRKGGSLYVLGPTQAFRYGGWIASGTAYAKEHITNALQNKLAEV